MKILENVFLLLGGIGAFLIALNLMSNSTGELVGNRISRVIKTCTKTRAGAFLTGCFSTTILQSSIATNMIAITFVQKGVLSFVSASAVILGTNVGTTITAQLVSFSTVSDFEVSAIGCLIVFIGFLCSLSSAKKIKTLGNALFGFGLIFIGLKLMTESVECFKSYGWFTNLFLVKNPILLLLNGFLITCIFQSSSVVTSILIVLSSLGLLDFYSSLFIILGTNVGTCLPVIFSSLKMSYECKKCAIFNLIFNIVGALIFFPVLYFGKDFILPILQSTSKSVGRNVANFHTLFNLTVSVVVMPFLSKFCYFVQKVSNFLFTNEKSFSKSEKKGNFLIKSGVEVIK